MKSLSFKQATLWTIIIFAIYQYASYPIGDFAPIPLRIPLMIAVAIISAIAMFYLYLSSEEKNPIELKKQKVMKSEVLILGLSGTIFMFLFQIFYSAIVTILTGMPNASQNTQNLSAITKLAPIFLLVLVICGPIMEEFVFRRSIAGFLSLYMNEWFAVIISSALFSIAHQDGHYLLYFAMGFVFSILYRATGSIYTSMIAHAGMNAIVMIIQLSLT